MNILPATRLTSGGRDLLYLRGILVEPICGVTVEFVSQTLGEHFIGRVQAKDESVQNGIFGMLDFFVSDRFLGQVVDVFMSA